MKICTFIILLINVYHFNAYSQLIEETDTLKIECGGFKGPYIITIILPTGFEKSTWRYKEGFYNTYQYPDSSEVTVNCGCCSNLNYFQRKTMKKLSTSDNSIRGEYKKVYKYWREDNYKVANFYYFNVPEDKLNQFNLALDKVTIISQRTSN